MKNTIYHVVVLMVTLSCNTANKSNLASQNHTQPLLNGTYTLQMFNNRTAIPKNVTITFDAATKQVSGFAGCNSFFGSYVLTHTTLQFKDIGVSQKYCFDETLNTFEKQFLDALKTEHTVTVNDNELLVSGNNSMRFTVADTDALPQTEGVTFVDLNPILITYETFSRGNYQHIEVSQTEIRISEDKSHNVIKTIETSAEEWKTITMLLNTINLKALSGLKPPTQKHQYDGAPHATLRVIANGDNSVTPTFDHGTPPKEIETLVNKVLSIAKKRNK